MASGAQDSTAILATAFGVALLATNAVGGGNGTLDPMTARELAVLSRVLERRLGDARRSLETASTHPAIRHPDSPVVSQVSEPLHAAMR